MGYDGVELRLARGGRAVGPRRDERAGMADKRGRLRDAGLEFLFDTARSSTSRPRARRRRSRRPRVAELAAARRDRHPCLRDQVQAGQDLDSTSAWIADALERLGEAARPLGVDVWIESHGDYARAGRMRALLERVNARAVGVVWDPCNAFEAGEEPAEGLEALGARVRHVHLKDTARLEAAAPREGRSGGHVDREGRLPPRACSEWPRRLTGWCRSSGRTLVHRTRGAEVALHHSCVGAGDGRDAAKSHARRDPGPGGAGARRLG